LILSLNECLQIFSHSINLKLSFFLLVFCLTIRNTLDFSTARIIATSIIRSKLDYCNSLFLNLPQSQLGRLQIILNSSARTVSKTPKFAQITPVLKSLHWLKIEQRIQYEVASIIYKVLQSQQPSYLQNLYYISSPTVLLASLTLSLSNFFLFTLVSY